jgi:hypothetical protein
VLQLASRRVLTSAQRSTDQFFADAEDGELPTYAAIEPQIIGHAHNGMHLAFSMQAPGLNFDPPSSLIAGEDCSPGSTTRSAQRRRRPVRTDGLRGWRRQT